jgi:arylsulfatase A-like enzyme
MELARFGYSLEQEGRVDEAERRYQAALEREPGHPTALNHLGVILVRTGADPVRGIELLERVALLRPHDGTVLYNLGSSYRQVGRLAEAYDLLQRSLAATDPEHPKFAERVAGLETARAALPRKSAPTDAPNIVLVMLDTVRADHLGAYGYARPTSPRIDAIALEGVVMEAAISQAPWTAASVGSIFTGLHPSVHGLDAGAKWGVGGSAGGLPFRVQKSLDSSLLTLAEMLRDHGYHTAGFVSNVYVNSIFGFGQGFDLYDDDHLEYSGDVTSTKRRASETNRRIFDWLEQSPAEPFFLFAHYNDAHWPYDPPSPFGAEFVADYQGGLTPGDTVSVVESRGAPITGMSTADVRYVEGLYDGEIQYLDSQVGELLDRLPEGRSNRDTLLMITSDHGEEFLEHGSASHGYTLYEEQLHVPLILHWPGRLSARRVPKLVASIDLLPTVLELISVGFRPGVLQGESFAALLRGGEGSGRAHVFAEATYRGDLQALRSAAGKKLIRSAANESAELYDLSVDPGELRDLTTVSLDEAAVLGGRLAEWQERNARVRSSLSGIAGDAAEVVLDEEWEARLRELGYIE